jgi:hypothetical protein
LSSSSPTRWRSMSHLSSYFLFLIFSPHWYKPKYLVNCTHQNQEEMMLTSSWNFSWVSVCFRLTPNVFCRVRYSTRFVCFYYYYIYQVVYRHQRSLDLFIRLFSTPLFVYTLSSSSCLHTIGLCCSCSETVLC